MPRSVRESIRNIQTVRRWWRRAGRARNRLLGKPDAWADLLAVCRRMRPGAVLDVGAHVGRMVERFADELTDVPIHAFEPTPRVPPPCDNGWPASAMSRCTRSPSRIEPAFCHSSSTASTRRTHSSTMRKARK